jgi:hypothetical protein
LEAINSVCNLFSRSKSTDLICIRRINIPIGLIDTVNPRDLFVNSRSLTVNPRDLFVNSRSLTVNPRDLFVNSRSLTVNPRDLFDSTRSLTVNPLSLTVISIFNC